MKEVSKVKLNHKYVIQVEDDWLSVLVRSWIACNKPCIISMCKPKSEGYAAVIINVQNKDCIKLVNRTKEFTKNIKIYEYE